MKQSRSVSPAVVLRVGCGRPDENSYPLAQPSVYGAPVPWVTWKVIFCPSDGLAGVPTVRFPPMVTRKSLPCEASTAIVPASVRATTAGATAPDSTVVAASAAEAREAVAAVSAAAPAPAAATLTAPLTMFLRVSIWPEPGSRWRVEDCRSIVPPLSAELPAEAGGPAPPPSRNGGLRQAIISAASSRPHGSGRLTDGTPEAAPRKPHDGHAHHTPLTRNLCPTGPNWPAWT